MGCDEVLRLLEDRESACRVEVERLQAESERIAVLLAERRGEWERVMTARQVIGELPAAHAAVASSAPVPVVAVPSPRGAAAVAVVDPAGVMSDEGVLAVLAERGSQKCRQVVEALGGDGTVAREVERARHRLKRLKDQGRVAESARGVFTLAGTRAAAIG